MALFHATTTNGASTILTNKSIPIEDEVFGFVIRQRLQLPTAILASATAPTECHCGERLLDPPPADAAQPFTLCNHLLCCRPSYRTTTTARHNMVARVVNELCVIAGCDVIPEIYAGVAPSATLPRLKPDACVFIDGGRDWIDYTITHPLTEPYAFMESKNKGKVILIAQKAKIRKYKRIKAQSLGNVVGFAISSFGGLGPHALAFLDKIRARLSKSMRNTKKVSFIMKLYYGKLAAAVQYGNWLIYRRTANLSALRKTLGLTVSEFGQQQLQKSDLVPSADEVHLVLSSLAPSMMI